MPVPDGLIEIIETVLLEQRGIVDEKPDRPERRGRFLHHRLCRGRIGKVRHDRRRFSALRADIGCKRLRISKRRVGMNGHGKAVGGKILDDSLANTPGTTGDQCCFQRRPLDTVVRFVCVHFARI